MTRRAVFFFVFVFASILSLGAEGLNVKEPTSLEQLSDVATLYINTHDGTSVSSKSKFVFARMWEVRNGEVTLYDSLQIRGRGNSTWGLAKKPYRLKFNEKVRLLGPERAKAKNWVLMANHADKTLLRNAVASAIGTALGQPFTPGARFVDVVLNGKYIGSYQITDFVDIRKHRVDIVEQDETLLPDADITGGYLFEADGFASGEKGYWKSSRGVPMSVKSPDAEIITAEQKEYLQNYVNTFETKLYSSVYTDPIMGYRPLVDSLTLASWFLATEYTANPDGYWSVYLYKEQQDDHMYWGPMWDYDIALNNCNRKGDVTQKLMVTSGFGDGVVKGWVQRLWSDAWFKRLTARMWREAREANLVDHTLAVVDSLAQVVSQTQALNFGIYPINQHVYNEITLYDSYQEGIDYMKRFLSAHAAYLDETFEKEVPSDGGTTPPPLPDIEPTPDPTPDDAEFFTPDATHYYHIFNVGNSHAADVDDNGVCTYSLSDNRHATQTWQLVSTDTLGTFQILLADSQLAITDPAQPSGEKYATGDQLTVTYREDGNLRQQWRAVRTANHWSIVNRQTGNAWNNSGGSSAEGNKIISWTNNEQNASKTTRQWRFELAEEIPGIEPEPGVEPKPDPDPEVEPDPDIEPTPDDGKEYVDFVLGQPYQVKQRDCGLYLNLVESEVKGTILGENPEPLYFVPEVDMPHTYTISSESGLFVGRHANSWNMSAYEPEKWMVEKVEDGLAIRLANGTTYIGFDSIKPGSAAFRDKNYLNYHGTFLIDEYVEPEPIVNPDVEPDPDIDPDPDVEPEPEPDGISPTLADYRISYSPELQRIALLCAEADAHRLSGFLEVTDLTGKVLLHQPSLAPLYIDSLPRGIYLLRWAVNGSEHSRKFMKQ